MKRKYFSLYFMTFVLAFSALTPLKSDYIPLDIFLKKAEKEKLTLPKPQQDGSYQSLNKRGSAFPISNNIIDDFIAYALQGEKRILHIDALFGHITLDALQNKITEYVATDSNEKHLALLAKRAKQLIPKENLKNLKLFHGAFPDSFRHFKDNSFDAILLNRVMHFYSPDQATHALNEALRVLKPGGKIFIVAITPYVKRFESFIPQYKQRLILKHQYPGHVKYLKYFANPEVTTPEQLTQMHDTHFMFFDAQFMHSILSDSGFIVEKSMEFPIDFTSSIWKLNGHELVGAIAKKPLDRSLFPIPTF